MSATGWIDWNETSRSFVTGYPGPADFPGFLAGPPRSPAAATTDFLLTPPSVRHIMFSVTESIPP